MIRFYCEACDKSRELPKHVAYAKIHCGVMVFCECGRAMHAVVEERGRSSNQKRSQDQEKRAAKHYGARRQKASGAIPGVKGDLRDPGRLRGECKFTRAASYSLKLEELRKLELEAGCQELPVFEIEFQNNPPFKRYVVLPQWAFDQLYAAWRTANGGT